MLNHHLKLWVYLITPRSLLSEGLRISLKYRVKISKPVEFTAVTRQFTFILKALYGLLQAMNYFYHLFI